MGISDALPQRTTSCTMLLLDIPVPFEQLVYFTLVRDLLQGNFSNSCVKCDAVAADSMCTVFSPLVLRGQTPLPGVSIVYFRVYRRLDSRVCSRMYSRVCFRVCFVCILAFVTDTVSPPRDLFHH